MISIYILKYLAAMILFTIGYPSKHVFQVRNGQLSLMSLQHQKVVKSLKRGLKRVYSFSHYEKF